MLLLPSIHTSKAHPQAHPDVYAEPEMDHGEPVYDLEYTEPKHAAAHHAKTNWKKTQKNGFYGEHQEAAWGKRHGSHHGHQSGDRKEIQTKEKKGFYHDDEAEVNGQKRRQLGG